MTTRFVRSMAMAAGFFLIAGLSAVGQLASNAPAIRGDAALTYQWMRTNTQPGECGCFGLNGGAIEASRSLNSRLALAVDVGGGYEGDGPSTGNSLTLVSSLAGVRYWVPVRRYKGPQPFAELLLGAAHAGGGIAGAGDGQTAFDSRIGGGVDVPLSPRFAIRVVQLDYDLTEFSNSTNNHQNNLRVGAGVVFRWSPRVGFDRR